MPDQYEKVAGHLISLGFEVKGPGPEFHAVHEDHPMLSFAFIGHSGRTVGLVFTGAHELSLRAKTKRADFLELVNRLNSDLHSRMMTCCFADPKGLFVVQAFYLGSYRKTDFHRFFELFVEEALKIMDHPDLQEYLK